MRSRSCCSNLPQLRPHALADRLAPHREPPYPVLPADVREAQEVERLRLAFSSSFPVLFGKRPELNPARLVGMEFQPNKRGRLGGLPLLLRPFSFLEAGAFVLFGPGDLLLEDVGGAKRPVGIAEEFASQQDYVGLSGGDDVLSLLGRGDHADGSG